MALTQTGEGLSTAARAVQATEARTALAFAAARRHSRWVRVLRVLLPLGSVAAVAGLIGATLVRNISLPIAGLAIDSMSVSGTKVTMANPKLSGGRPDGSSYVLNAQKAIQYLKDPTEVELVTIVGDIGSKNQPATNLTATAGHYNTASEKLQLSGVVQLKNANYTIDLKSADVDFKANVYTTREPIHVVTSSGMTVEADSARAEDNATKLSFSGHVKTTVPAQQDKNAPTQMKSENP